MTENTVLNNQNIKVYILCIICVLCTPYAIKRYGVDIESTREANVIFSIGLRPLETTGVALIIEERLD